MPKACLDLVTDCYSKKQNVFDFVRTVQFVDHTLFEIIKQFVPQKANLNTGLLIEPHYLERNKFKREIPTTDMGQSMLPNSYQTFEFEMDPNNRFSISESVVITTNNLSPIKGSDGLRQQLGTNAIIDILRLRNLKR